MNNSEELPSTSNNSIVVVEQIPCSSNTAAAAADGEILNQDDENLNQSLENFAKNYNLSAQNVKNIIFHVVRNPQTFSTLIENNPEVTNNIRLTRARLKELEKISNLKLGIAELKPVNNLGKTFLDVDYAEDDDDDEDYHPDEEDALFPDENDPEWRQLRASVSPTRNMEEEFMDSAIEDEPMDINDINDAPQLLTNVDDPDYLKFVNSCLEPGQEFFFENEDEDEEFNVLNQLEFEEPEEYRMDRSTKIPKWEIKALREDLIEPKETILENIPQMAKITQFEAGISTSPQQNKIPSTIQKTPVIVVDDIPLQNLELLNNSMDSAPKNQTFFAGSLLNEIVHFSEEERKILKIQMEQHVQLLTQTIVGTYGDESLIYIRNNAINMLSELDKEFNNPSQIGEKSLFNIANLSDGIYSCHDILACEGVDLPTTTQPFMDDYVKTDFIPGFSESQTMKNEIMWVLSQSRALKYPELVPKLRFAIFPRPCSQFFRSEQLLLAMALFSLKNVKHSSWRNSNGKYPLIAKHYLPARTIVQIRNHLKNIRCSTAVSNPINEIVCQAEKGIFKGTILLDSEAKSAQNEIPINWPENVQTGWLKNISKWFKQGAIQVVPKSNIITNLEIVSPNNNEIINNNEIVILENKNSLECATGEENSNDQFSDLLEGVDEFVESTSSSLTTAQQLLDPSKQKSRRKFRIERGVEKLSDPKIRSKTLRALVEAVNCDFKQRFFMHQDKLKELQAIISNTQLTVPQIFNQLNQKLGNQHPQILALFSALVSDSEELDPTIASNSQRRAYQKAFEMIINIQTYLSGCSSNTGIRNAFKNIKDACDNASEEDLYNRIKNHFGVRDEPLWRLLKTQISKERYNEKVEDWEYEFIDMEKIGKEDIEEGSSYQTSLDYETVCLPYRFEPSERGRLRVRRGRVTMEHNGRLKTVNIGYTTDHNDGNTSKKQWAPWTRDDDKALLMSFKKHNGDPQRTIEEFLSEKKTNVSALETSRRLDFLMGILKRVL